MKFQDLWAFGKATHGGRARIHALQIRDFKRVPVNANEAFRPRRYLYLKRHLEGASPARRAGTTQISVRGPTPACQESRPPDS
jgi:hypothetical protein